MLILLGLGCVSAPKAEPPVVVETPVAAPAEPAIPAPPPVVRAPDGTVMQPCMEAAPAGMACISGGAFLRGTDEPHVCGQGENRRALTGYGPRSEVWVSTFYMDVTEVTFGAYQECVKRGDCRASRPAYNDYDRPQQPMVGMSWYDAAAYCEKNGRHLPTEAEWEKAARGTDGAPGPFGNVPSTCENAVVRDGTGRGCGTPKKEPSPEKGRTLEVRSRPVGQYGLFDMVGNAEEYVDDWFAPDLSACGAACAGTDPKGPCAGAEACPDHPLKMVKGGSWYWGAEHAYAWHRRPHVPTNRPYHHFGFRCAASVDEARALVEGGAG